MTDLVLFWHLDFQLPAFLLHFKMVYCNLNIALKNKSNNRMKQNQRNNNKNKAKKPNQPSYKL